MAELTPKAIGELPAVSSASASDLFVISSGGESKKITWGNLKSTIGWQYDGDHGSTTQTWTAPYDGFAIASATWDTSREQAYWYIKDVTSNVFVARLFAVDANGSGLTTSFPVLKNHVYDGATLASHVSIPGLYCYRLE